MIARIVAAALALLVTSGCVSLRGSSIGVSRTVVEEPPPPPAPSESEADSGTDPLYGIDEPFHGERVSDGELFSDVGLLDELATYDLICVGEQHDNALHHWAQLAVLYGLSTRAEMSGRSLALGLEMVDRSFQPQLDRFHDGEVTLAELPKAIEWRSRWGFDFALYRPLFEMAKSRGLPILALNASREVARDVARNGLRRVNEETRAQLPVGIDLRNAPHRAAFEAAIAEHPHRGNPEHLYQAQVVWDETMAETAAEWLRREQPAHQILIAAGVEHCRRFSVPDRVLRRVSGGRVVSVLPSQGDAPTDETTGYDFVMVLGTTQ